MDLKVTKIRKKTKINIPFLKGAKVSVLKNGTFSFKRPLICRRYDGAAVGFGNVRLTAIITKKPSYIV